MRSISLSNLLLLSGGASFGASFAFRNVGQQHSLGAGIARVDEPRLERRNRIRLDARKKAVDDDDNGTDNKVPEMDPAKRAALQGVLGQIERNYGRGSVVRLGDASHMAVESTPSGSLTLDAALGGGYPKGRVVEIYGPESSGKTTLALHAIAECQRKGGTAAFIDAEHALDPVYGALQPLCRNLIRLE